MNLALRARSMTVAEAHGVKPGDYLCSEPWYPCWNPATRYRLMENGTVSLRCDECANVPENPELPFNDHQGGRST